MKKGKSVWIFVGFQSGFVHDTPDSEVSQEECIEFLPNKFRRFASQHDA